MKVRSQSNLVRRSNGVFYFRARIPADLVAVLKRRERWVSLQTRDEAEAKRRVRTKLVELDHEYEAVRSKSKAAQVTPEAAERLGLLFVEAALREDEQWRRNGTTRENLDAWENVLTDDLAEWREAVATGRLDRRQTRQLDEWMGELRMVPSDADRRVLAHAFARANVRAAELLLARNAGQLVPSGQVPARPSEKPAPLHSQDGLPISQAFDRWYAERQPSERTKADWSRALRLFVELNGDLRLPEIGKRHLVAVKDALIAKGRAPKTVGKLLAALGTVLSWASNNDLIPINPASGLKVAQRKVEREKRLPFSTDQLNALFRSPVYALGERPQGGAGEAAYWLPVAAMWTGARLEELGQLTVDDVKTEDGHPVIVISDRGEGKVKTASSRRRVPIAPTLVDLGFLRYVEYIRGQRGAGGRLFPALRSDRQGTLTGNWSKWHGRYLRETVGITDKRVVFHSHRHGFKAACRAAGIEEAIHDNLTGHASASIGRSYGAGLDYPLWPLVDAVGRLRFPGVVLPAPWGPPGKRT
jgi:integrase